MRETTRGRGQSHRGAHTQDRSICTLGVTEQVYTYYLEGRSVHACTQPRSKYVLCRAPLYVLQPLLGSLIKSSL